MLSEIMSTEEKKHLTQKVWDLRNNMTEFSEKEMNYIFLLIEKDLRYSK